MALDAIGLSQIVEQQHYIEQTWCVCLADSREVSVAVITSSREYIIEFLYGVQGVDICCINVIILVLDEACEASKFGNVSAENSQFMHGKQNRCDVAQCL